MTHRARDAARRASIEKALENLGWMREALSGPIDTGALHGLVTAGDLDLLRSAVAVLDYYCTHGEAGHVMASALLFARQRSTTALRACELFAEQPNNVHYVAAVEAVDAALNDVQGVIEEFDWPQH